MKNSKYYKLRSPDPELMIWYANGSIEFPVFIIVVIVFIGINYLLQAH